MSRIKVNFKNPKNGNWVEVELYGTTMKQEVIRDVFHQLDIKDNPRDYTISLASWDEDLNTFEFKEGCHLLIVKKTESIAPCVRFFRKCDESLEDMYQKAKSQCSNNFKSSKLEI